MNLKQKTYSAVRWTTLAMAGKSTLQFLQMAVLARLLAPADFGLMAMVLAILAFVQAFSDFGVSNAIIHRQDVSGEQLSSLYWLSVAIATGLVVVLLGASHGISVILFEQPDLQPVLVAVSFSVLFTALGQQVRVMAEKSLHFSILAKIEIASAFVGFGVAISWALISPSVYALVAGLVMTSFIQSALLWLLAARGWRPAFRLHLDEIRHFLRFGGYMMANNFVNSINSQADIFIAGKMFPAAVVGLYSLPRNLSLSVAGVINPIITRVGLPVMARAQGDRVFLKAVYLKTMRMTASVNFPIYVGMATFSEEIVLLVFGREWLESAPLLAFLAFWGMFRSCGNPVGSLLLAVGKADLAFKWNLALLFIVLPVLWGASHWGIAGLAIGQAMLAVALLVPGWYILVRPNCGARGLEYAMTLMVPLLVTLLAVGLCAAAAEAFAAPVVRLATAAFVFVPTYILLSYMLNRSWVVAMRQLFSR